MNGFDIALLATITLLLRGGHALLVCGSVRSKSAASVAVRLLLDFSIVMLGVWAVGAAFVSVTAEGVAYFNPGYLFGFTSTSTPAMGLLVPLGLIATAALHGAVAERTRLMPVLVTSLILATFVIPIAWQCSYRLSTGLGFVDSGVGIAAISGGAAALVGAIIAGPRKGKFNRDQSVNFVPGHNIVLQLMGLIVIGAGLCLVGGGGFNVLLGFSAATLCGAMAGRFRYGKTDTGLMMAAGLTGLIATASGAGVLPSWGAVLVGMAGGLIAPWLAVVMETRYRIDDVTSSVTPHVLGGVLGMTAAALLQISDNAAGESVTIGQRLSTLGAHALTAGIAMAAAGAVTMMVFTFARRNKCLRVSETAEFDGGDLTELDLNAYPDFQQTMIKSYHLREL
jgi:ammonium transporter, Amt family